MSEPSEWAHVGPIPGPENCGDCGDPTHGESALCGKCAWNRYYDRLDEWHAAFADHITEQEEAS